MGKLAEKDQRLIKKMAANHYQWTNERDNSKRPTGMLEIDILNMLSAKIDNVFKILNKQVGDSTNSQEGVGTSRVPALKGIWLSRPTLSGQ